MSSQRMSSIEVSCSGRPAASASDACVCSEYNAARFDCKSYGGCELRSRKMNAFSPSSCERLSSWSPRPIRCRIYEFEYVRD